MQKDVANLHKEMLGCFEAWTKAEEVQDIDHLGNIVYKDAGRPTRNHWGFSYAGLAKIKENEENFKGGAVGYGNVKPLRPDVLKKFGGGVGVGGGRGGRGGLRGGPS